MSAPMLSRFTRFFTGCDVAVDLGTANTRVRAAGDRAIVDVPTRVRVARAANRALAGAGGRRLPRPELVTPLREGVVKDVAAATAHLRNLLRQTAGFRRPRVLVCAPSDVTREEREALVAATRNAGAAAVAIVPEPLAASVGAGLDVASPYAQMLVDIGDGVTDIAVVRDGQLVRTAATRTAGSDLHRAVQRMTAARYPAIISRAAAEMLTHRLGAVGADAPRAAVAVCGVDDDGRKVALRVRSRDVRAAIDPVVWLIVETIDRAVRALPPDVCAEVAETGICLTGGVARLPGLAARIAGVTNLPVTLAPAPLESVIAGASLMLETSARTNFWNSFS